MKKKSMVVPSQFVTSCPHCGKDVVVNIVGSFTVGTALDQTAADLYREHEAYPEILGTIPPEE